MEVVKREKFKLKKKKQHAKLTLNELAKFVQLTAEHEISMRWSIGAMMEKSH
jgi:hypothetical protein